MLKTSVETENEAAILAAEFEEKCSMAELQYAGAFDDQKAQEELRLIKKELNDIDKDKYSEPEKRRDQAGKLKEALKQLSISIKKAPLRKPLPELTVHESCKQLMDTLIFLISKCDVHMLAMINAHGKNSPLSDPGKTKKITKGFNLLAQAYKKKKAYSNLQEGKKYKLAGIQKPSDKPLGNSNVIRDLSAKNLLELKLKLKKSGDSENLFGLKADEIELFAELLNLPFSLQHATNRFYEIAHSESLDSLAELRRRHPNTTSFFSTKGNIDALGNDGFVFFRVYINGFNGETTRYGNTRIVTDMHLLRTCGWVSLHDQLYPFSTTNAKRVYVEKRLLVTSQPVPINCKSKSKKALYDGLENAYRLAPLGDLYKGQKDAQKSFGSSFPVTKEVVPFTSEIFYGGDILTGIALSTIAKLRKLDQCGYRKQFLETFKSATNPDERIRQAALLLMKFFRIEAKYPVRLELRFQNNEYHFVMPRNEIRSVYIDNPDGDHRLTKDLTINFEDYKDTLIADKLAKLDADLRSARRLAARISSDENIKKRDELQKQCATLKALQTQRTEMKKNAIESITDACSASDEIAVRSINMTHLLLIHNYFLFLLENEKVTLTELIKTPCQRLLFLSDAFFLELLESVDVSLRQLNDLSIEELSLLKTFDISVALNERDIGFDEVAECLRTNQQRLYYLCYEDLDDALLDAAPEVPEELMILAEEIGYEFDMHFVRESLCESEQALFNLNLENYSNQGVTADTETEEDEDYKYSYFSK